MKTARFLILEVFMKSFFEKLKRGSLRRMETSIILIQVVYAQFRE